MSTSHRKSGDCLKTPYWKPSRSMCQRSKGCLEMWPMEGNQGDPQAMAGQVWTRMQAGQKRTQEDLASNSKANKNVLQNTAMAENQAENYRTNQETHSEEIVFWKDGKSSQFTNDRPSIQLHTIHSLIHFFTIQSCILLSIHSIIYLIFYHPNTKILKCLAHTILYI